MPTFKDRPDPTTSMPPQALPQEATVAITDEIRQRERVDPQRSFTAPVGGDDRSFPPVLGTVPTGYPSTRSDASSLKAQTQPANPKIGPIKPRRQK